MKNRRRDLVLIFSLLCLGAASFFYAKKLRRADSGPLRVSIPLDKPAGYYDPAKTQRAVGQYFFLENIYTPLLEYTPEGKLVSAAADSFGWQGNDARFAIRRGLYTAGGHEVDAYDAEASLKRLFILDRAARGDLEARLCRGRRLAGLRDACPGIKVQDGGRVLVLSFAERSPHIFTTLATIDFAVVPKTSIDPVTLAITDYRNTSGPYFVERDDPRGKLVLRANPRHFHYSPAMPQEVELVPYDPAKPEELLRMFSAGEIDLITTLDKLPCEVMIGFVRDNGRTANLHRTYPIKLFLAAFTAKGMKGLNERERWNLGRAIKETFNRHALARAGYENSDQLFTLEGTLSDSALSAIAAKFGRPDPGSLPARSLTVWDGTGILYDNAEDFSRVLPRLKVLKMKKNPVFTDFKKEKLEEPDLYVAGYNVGLQDDIGLVAYHMNTGTLLPRKVKKEDWMRIYTREEDKARRFELMRALQYESLEQAVVVPLAIAPYTAIARKPWKFHLPRHLAGNPVWRISRD
ncbi:MAG TPA: hypothetical protein PKI19_06705 [Elusimicrobiales bacterium]|nr:hypothetical protein [Elusimicrobiales bacterium]